MRQEEREHSNGLALPPEAPSNTPETLPFHNGGQARGQWTLTKGLGVAGGSSMGFMLRGGLKATERRNRVY